MDTIITIVLCWVALIATVFIGAIIWSIFDEDFATDFLKDSKR